MSERIHKVKRGNVERWSFGKIKEIIDILKSRKIPTKLS